MKVHTFVAPSLALIGGVASLFLIGCASVLHGTHQRISVASVPPGAEVMVQNARAGVTPAKIEVRRKDKDVILRFEKEGYKPVEVTLRRKVSGAVWGNIALGGVIGFIVDFANGAAYKMTPNEVSANMDSNPGGRGPVSSATPRQEKDSILVIFRERLPREAVAGEKVDTE